MLEYRTFGPEIGDSELSAVASLLAICLDEPLGADFVERVREKHRLQAVMAYVEGRLVGCKLGYERSRGVFYSWLGGVHPAHRRSGIARELMRRQHALCTEQGYGDVLTETTNAYRGMLLLNLVAGFDFVGTYVNDRKELVLMLHKSLRAGSPEPLA